MLWLIKLVDLKKLYNTSLVKGYSYILRWEGNNVKC